MVYGHVVMAVFAYIYLPFKGRYYLSIPEVVIENEPHNLID